MARIGDIVRITTEDLKQMERIMRSPGISDLDSYMEHHEAHDKAVEEITHGPRVMIFRVRSSL